MQKLVVIALSILVLGSSLTYSEFRRHQRQTQQITDYERHVQQLLGDIERSSLRRLEYEKQISQLGSELTELRSTLASVSSQLQLTQERVNPEYQALEQKIRREIRNEMQVQQAPRTTSPRIDLFRQMNELDPMELNELMSLQGQYGGFLQSLNVSDQRMEVIVDALSNLVAEQNQARMEFMSQIRLRDTNPQAIRREMQNLDSPQVQREALSYVLTDEEMAAFTAFQASQPNLTFARSFISADAPGVQGGGDTVIMRSRSTSPDGNINVEIITADPR